MLQLGLGSDRNRGEKNSPITKITGQKVSPITSEQGKSSPRFRRVGHFVLFPPEFCKTISGSPDYIFAPII